MTSDVLRSYNRDTAWLATGVLGAVVLAAIMLAVEERQTDATQAERDLLPNANSAAVESVVAKTARSDDKVTSGLGTSVDHSLPETPPQGISSSRMDPAASLLPSLLTQSVTYLGMTPAPKTRNAKNRSSLASRFIGVKRRLIELWHQSLARSENRSWTGFSKLNSGLKKKAAYTAATRD